MEHVILFTCCDGSFDLGLVQINPGLVSLIQSLLFNIWHDKFQSMELNKIINLLTIIIFINDNYYVS